MTLPVLPFRGVQIVRFQARQSPGNLSDLLAGRSCDPRRFRALYPDRWSAFLRAHFQNHMHVAVFFDVEEKTARLWWEGVTGPKGWVVDYAIRALPAARKWLEAG